MAISNLDLKGNYYLGNNWETVATASIYYKLLKPSTYYTIKRREKFHLTLKYLTVSLNNKMLL